MKMPEQIYAHAKIRCGDQVLLDVYSAPTTEPDCTAYVRKDIVDGLKRELKEALYHWRDHLFSLHDVDMEGEHSLYLLSREPELRAEIEQMDSELGGGS